MPIGRYLPDKGLGEERLRGLVGRLLPPGKRNKSKTEWRRAETLETKSDLKGIAAYFCATPAVILITNFALAGENNNYIRPEIGSCIAAGTLLLGTAYFVYSAIKNYGLYKELADKIGFY